MIETIFCAAKPLTESLFSDREKFRQQIAEGAGVAPATIQVDEEWNFFWEKEGTRDGGMLLFRATPLGVRVKQCKEDRCDVMLLGDIKGEKLADGICVSQNGPVGILRTEQGEDVSYLEPLDEVQIGEGCYLQPNTGCKGDKLYGTQAGTVTLVCCAIASIRLLAQTDYAVKVAFVNESACGAEKSLEQIYRQEPQSLLVCSPATADDSFVFQKGPGVLKKDGGCVIAQSVFEKVCATAQDAGIQTQSFVGNTGNTLSRLYPALKSKKLAGIYFPVKKMGCKTEVLSQKDVEKTQKLLLKCLQSFAIIFE